MISKKADQTCLGLNRETCLRHLVDIGTALGSAIIDGALFSDVRWLLVQFADWRQVALFLCFGCDRSVR